MRANGTVKGRSWRLGEALCRAGLALALAAGCSSPGPRVSGTEVQGLIDSGVDLGVCAWDELWIVARAADGYVAAPDAGWTATDPETGATVALPLARTVLRADVVGRLATVALRQAFENPFDEPVEGEYSFPLPSNAAVSDFVVTIGTRHIRAIVREREEARRIYEAARAQGRLASLLQQESAGRFRQRVANVAPRSTIEVQLEYFQALGYQDGWCELALPLARRDEAHEVALEVVLDAGVAIEELECSHQAAIEAPAPERRAVRLRDVEPGTRTELRLRYRVGGSTTRAALLGSDDAEGGTFCLLVYPGAAGTTAGLVVDWGDLAVRDVYTDDVRAAPGAARVFLGRYRGGGGAIRLREGGRSTPVELQAKAFPARSLARTWARARIAAFARLAAAASADPALVARCADAIRELALAHGLSSVLTAFVLVDARS